MQDAQDAFDWKPLGEEWWRAAAKDVRVRDERQIKFACCKHRGCSNTESARQSGYTTNEDAVRQVAYRVFRSNAVQDLLAFAAAEAKGGHNGTVDSSEARRILSNLARGSDPSIKIRAVEAIAKLDERAAEAGLLTENDGLSGWRIARDYLQQTNGGPAFALLYTGSGVSLGSIPLMHDVHATCMRDDPHLWARLYQRETAAARALIDRKLRDPDYQWQGRAKIWREVGVEIEGVKEFSGPVAREATDADTAASPAAEAEEQSAAA